jgi:hypothetical protein
MSRTAFGLITSRLSRAISSCSCLSLISLTASSLDLRVNSVFYMIHLGSIGVFGTGSPILGTGPAVSKIASAPRRNLTRNYSSQSARSSRLEMPTSPRCRGVSLEMLITPRDFSKALKSRKDAAKPENENVRTTVHTPPYTAVRQIVRTPVPAGGAAAGVWNRASTRKLRSLRRRAVGLHLPGWRAGRKIPGVLPHGSVEMHLSTLRFHRSGLRRITPPTMPSADFCAAVRAPYGALSRVAGTQCKSPEVRPTAFTAHPPNLPPRPLMAADFAVICADANIGNCGRRNTVGDAPGQASAFIFVRSQMDAPPTHRARPRRFRTSRAAASPGVRARTRSDA